MEKKIETKIYLPPDVFEQIDEATKQFRGAGRQVSRSEVITQLLEDGLGVWRREKNTLPRIDATLGVLLDKAEATDKILKSILLTLADGDKAEVERLIATITGEKVDA